MSDQCDVCTETKDDVYGGQVYTGGTSGSVYKKYCGDCFAKANLEECVKCDNYVQQKEAFRDDDDEDRAICPDCARNYHITEKFQ